jgi:hypothetical protein
MIARTRSSQDRLATSAGDRKLRAAVIEALTRSRYGALRRLDCRVLGGVVEISGTVSSFYLKQLAQAAVLELASAGTVRNLVEVSDEPTTD